MTHKHRSNKNKTCKTYKNGGTVSNRTGGTNKSVAESLAKQKVPEQVITQNIMSFLNDFDKMRVSNVNTHNMYEDMKKHFKPTINYNFICDLQSYTDKERDLDFYLENTMFDPNNNTKQRIDACVKDDAIQYLLHKHGEYFDINAQMIDMYPSSDVNVVVSIRLKRNRQAISREPDENTPIVINGNHKKSRHNVALFTSYGPDENYGAYGVLLQNCKNLYAHEKTIEK
jgi:hypothetical protein